VSPGKFSAEAGSRLGVHSAATPRSTEAKGSQGCIAELLHLLEARTSCLLFLHHHALRRCLLSTFVNPQPPILVTAGSESHLFSRTASQLPSTVRPEHETAGPLGRPPGDTTQAISAASFAHGDLMPQ